MDYSLMSREELIAANQELQSRIARLEGNDKLFEDFYWERKRTEESLRQIESRFKALADTAPAVIFVYSNSNTGTPLRYLNNSFIDISGYSQEELFNFNWWTIIHPEDRAILQQKAVTRLQGFDAPDRYEARILAKNGRVFWMDMAVNSIDWEGEKAVIGIMYDISGRKQTELELLKTRDELENRVMERTAELLSLNEKMQQEITERRLVEQELLLSETRYRAIIEEQKEFVIRAKQDTALTFVNEAFCRFVGQKANELIGKSFLDMIYPEDQNKIINLLSSMENTYAAGMEVFRTISANGEIRWQEWTGSPIRCNPDIIEIQAVGRDISDRKIAEEALLRSEANFRKLADTSPALIYVSTLDHFLYINSTCLTKSGYSREQMETMNPWNFLRPDYHALVMKNVLARQKGDKVLPYEVVLLGRNGKEIYGYLYADIIDYEGQKASLVTIMDITERKNMEEDLLQASKLESLGILAGGIAHDFNNILTVISGNISLAKMIIDSEDEVSELINEVEQAAWQARDLTQQLLTFSKGGAPIKETASIQDLLRDTSGFVLRGSNVSCNYAIPEDLWTVSIDKGQISQVINNLIINADQAMPEGGVIILKAENCSEFSEASTQSGNYVKIDIIDAGMGIAPEDLPKIFDPYFSTKSKGHGLGLASSYSIIKKHDGHIKVSSIAGEGTTVSIYLPAFPEKKIRIKKAARQTLSGQGKILIMDDEQFIRDTLSKMLYSLGYTTETAANGQQAIYIYQQAIEAGNPYDAVIMDLTIAGGMGGKETVKKLLEIDPTARVIVSSGYSNDPVMADFTKYGFCGVLPKPYLLEGVNQVLHEVLSGTKEMRVNV